MKGRQCQVRHTEEEACLQKGWAKGHIQMGEPELGPMLHIPEPQFRAVVLHYVPPTSWDPLCGLGPEYGVKTAAAAMFRCLWLRMWAHILLVIFNKGQAQSRGSIKTDWAVSSVRSLLPPSVPPHSSRMATVGLKELQVF